MPIFKGEGFGLRPAWGEFSIERVEPRLTFYSIDKGVRGWQNAA